MCMNKNIFWLIGALLSVSFFFTACDDDDTPTADPNSEWAVRNKEFLDSIAHVCANPPVGEVWTRFLSYKLQNSDGGLTPTMWQNTDYVFAKILPYIEEEGSVQPQQGISPLATDTVSVHYRGTLFNGEVFDESYSGKWNQQISESVKFSVSGVIDGWTTALMNMKEYSRAVLYIPYTLSYGEFGSNGIPGYSTLVFDVRLEKVIHPKGPDDRKLKSSLLKR